MTEQAGLEVNGAPVSSPLLQARKLSVRFGGLVAVDAVSVTFEAGELIGIIGPNGAGKTTFFNAISGVIQPVRNAPEFRGKLELSFSGTLDGKPWTMPLPGGSQALQFKQYRRVEGMVDLPPEAVVKNVSARIVEGSVSRAVQNVSL